MSNDDKPTVTAEAVGITEDSLVIFKLNHEDLGYIGVEKAKELGLIEAGYEYGEYENYLPVIEEEQDEPELTRGFVNSNQPLRGELKLEEMK